MIVLKKNPTNQQKEAGKGQKKFSAKSASILKRYFECSLFFLMLIYAFVGWDAFSSLFSALSSVIFSLSR